MGVGYVLGAKAGEKRYAELKALWDRTSDVLADSPSVRRFGKVSRDAGSRTADVVATRAQSGAQRFTSAVRDGSGRRFVSAARERGQVE
jgi:hypothetical protein